MFGIVSASVGAICLLGALLIATVGRMHWPRVVVALVLTGMTGLLNTSVGRWLHDGATRLDTTAAHVVGRWTGVVVTGLAAIAVLAAAAFWVWHRHINMRTLGAVAAVPLTITLIPGTVGAVAIACVSIVPTVIAGLVSAAFGIR